MHNEYSASVINDCGEAVYMGQAIRNSTLHLHQVSHQDASARSADSSVGIGYAAHNLEVKSHIQ